MTLDEVFARVEQIGAMGSDPEAAHAAEDRLRADVLTAIANGAAEPHLLAMAALHTDGFDFPRWCA